MTLLPEGNARMLLWSPFAEKAGIEITGKGFFPLEKIDFGYWEGVLPGVGVGDRYMVVIDNDRKIPDPASLSQPDGVHAPSEVIDTRYSRQSVSGWKGIPAEDLIIYELHTGTFSPEGTFEGIIRKLDYLAGLGINAIELMPVNAFPGSRNWGYDGVYPFAVQHSYGGYAGLSELTAACHKKNIAVILDVVYNHLGPEGNYLSVAGPYFTDKYQTPWGSAINFDDAWCDGVRRYFIENALMWLRDFGVDGLRIDAVHAIKDLGTVHFLAELAGYVEDLNMRTGKQHFLVGECDLNDVKYITPLNEGGVGLNNQWCDEFHHALHARLTGERDGYYSDFGSTSHVVASFNEAYVYNGKYSTYRRRTFGSSTLGFPGYRFVVFTQNHDQVGNRMLGERSGSLVDFESLKLMAGAMFVSPFIPMLFMGEEYGEDAPFLYFTSHGDKELINAVREGRKNEFSEFMSGEGPPDAQSEDTFERSKLRWDFQGDEKKGKLLEFYKKLIHLKKTHPALKPGIRDNIAAVEAGEGNAILLRIGASREYEPYGNNIKEHPHLKDVTSAAAPGNSEVDCSELKVIMNLSKETLKLPVANENAAMCTILLYSAHTFWGGPVSGFASLGGHDGMVDMEPRSIMILSPFRE